jgi:signal transduction histidine kinase
MKSSQQQPRRRSTDRIKPVSPNALEADGSIYKDIAINAQDVLRVGFVQMMRVDWEAQMVNVVTATDLYEIRFQQALEQIRGVFPKWDTTRIQYAPDVGDWARAVYFEGKTVVIPTLKQSSYLTPLVVRLAQLVGLRHSLIVPVIVGGRVLASLSFTQRLPNFSEASRKTAESFARQAALTLENALLNAQLREQLTRLEHSQRLAVEAEERTRREIAEFLHGRVQTRLLLAWNQLSDYPDLPDETSRATLVRNVCDDLERIRETDVRQASHVLHPSVIRMGLVSACRSLASRIADVLPVQIEVSPGFTELDVIGKSKLPTDVRLIAYRVIEEAIGNTLRHAKASRVKLNFSRVEQDTFEVVIQDDGCGFDTTQPSAGLGFASIDARVHAVHGLWNISSQIGGPTELMVRLPLESNQRHAAN